MQFEVEETSFHGAVTGVGAGSHLSSLQQQERTGVNSNREPYLTTVTEAPPQLPTDVKGYYACRSCRRILVEAQWYREGCLGCRTGPVHRGELAEYATPHFTNFFGLIDPSRSWVARLIGKGGLLPDGSEVPNAIYAEALDDEDDEALEDDEEEEEEEGGVGDAGGNSREGASHSASNRSPHVAGISVDDTRLQRYEGDELGF